MNIALIIAGGVGQRVGRNIPKQFIKVDGKPIIVYTLANAQNCGVIDAIVVVCKSGWESEVKNYTEKYKINKLKAIIVGGETRFDSVKNGINFVTENFSNKDNIILVDANRPLIPQYVFTDGIERLNAVNGSVLSVENCFDTMFMCVDGQVVETVNRDVLFKGQGPEFMRISDVKEIYSAAEKEGINDKIPTQLMLYYGKKVYQSTGSPLSFKITVEEDIDVFKAMLKVKENKE